MASIGKITGVNGNLIRVKFESAVSQNEVAYAKLISKNEAGKTEIIPLKSEVIRIRGDYAELQVFEDTTGLKAGDEVEFTGELLSVELGPGLLTQVFDGLQNPLPKLADECGFFLQFLEGFKLGSKDFSTILSFKQDTLHFCIWILIS